MPSALVWQISRSILDQNQSRPAQDSSTFGNCLSSTRNISFQYSSLWKRGDEFSLESLWSICIRNVFQLLSFNTVKFWRKNRAYILKNARACNYFQRFWNAQVWAGVFILKN